MISQAQIEAAAKAIFTARMLRNDGQWDCQTEAKAAITAAAEVDKSELEKQYDHNADLDREIERLKAECIKAAKEIDKIADRAESEFKEKEAATIERCAQVAIQWEKENYPGNFNTLIERIRALKDKTAAAAKVGQGGIGSFPEDDPR